MKSVCAVLVSFSIFISSAGRASVVKEQDGGVSDYYVKVDNNNDVVTFKKCLIVTHQCRFIGSANGYRVKDIAKKRVWLKRFGWIGTGVITATVVVGTVTVVAVGGAVVGITGAALSASGVGIASSLGIGIPVMLVGIPAAGLATIGVFSTLPMPHPFKRFEEADSINQATLTQKIVVVVPSMDQYITDISLILSSLKPAQ